MLIYPAIDLYDGKAVRLLRGDYAQMTVYHNDPAAVAQDFLESGAVCVHLVDLEGAKSGTTPNFETVRAIKERTGLFCEIGGGIRSIEVIDRYLDAGIDRVILGTAAVTDPAFAEHAAKKYGEKVAIGIDIRDGFVAIRGWTETSALDAFAFTEQMRNLGIGTLICTDISRDGAMQGTNRALYRSLSERFDMKIIASGGVSTLDDIASLASMGLHGAIVGRAYYTGAIVLSEAIRIAAEKC